MYPPAVQMLTATTPGVGSTVRFHGFLLNNNGSLALIALVEGHGPGTPIGPMP